MNQVMARIRSNQPLTMNCWRMELEAPQVASEVKPGQFVMVRMAAQAFDPLFRRPFSIFRGVNKVGIAGIELVYEVVGKGTRLMTTMAPGDQLDVIGPLGHGFELSLDRRAHVLVSSKTGAAGLFMLGEEVLKLAGDHKLFVLLDAKTRESLVLEEEFRSLNATVLVSTHDGSYGYHGYVTELLRNAIESGDIPTDCAIYACGPEPMLKALAPICQEYNLPAQVSMQRSMACGIGACLSCVCRVSKQAVLRYRELKSSHIQFSPEAEFGYALVCKDGPVFRLDEVILDE